ncbi:hydrogenase maturation nickel metallochaperone HypA [Desulforamulus ruminis]|uniref:Hydrogenase maturation factor HypA n=1 Tax=Desulforamulus ruminis (strain ATCC 23193 / DSM 2154 / NCIMB 8452 / DL) TaxID=696281 RepID=F6DMD9_DESRL|nr:hydrogenase maturation nickel metallochaperone HypA [Desulforamulus ruminis]AEG60606.1 hydrogenase expression/synthesis HypA [Desulforamulus ruminis DSM 2154]
MHELSMAQDLLKILGEYQEELGSGRQIKEVHLKVGKFTSVVPETLGFCYELLVQNTSFAGTRLIIEEIPLVIRCRRCLRQKNLETPRFHCPDCSSEDVEMVAGGEMIIDFIQVEEAEKEGMTQDEDNSFKTALGGQ